MSKVLGALVAAVALVAVTGCATPTPTPASPSPGQSPEQTAPSESPASDACASLTGDDVRAAIMAVPGWSYDLWVGRGGAIGLPQPLHLVGEVDYIAPDRVRQVGWDPVGIRHGEIIIGDRMWTYSGLPASSPPDPADSRLAASNPSSAAYFARMLKTVFPFKHDFPFPGDLPGGGLRESPRVADTECLATDPNTGTSLITTRSGQLVRMTTVEQSDKDINGGALIFSATMPRPIEPPTVADLKTEWVDP